MIVGVGGLVAKNLLDLSGLVSAMNIVEGLSVPALMLGVFALLPSVRLPSVLTRNSFAVFLVHNAFLSIVAMCLMLIRVHGNVEFQLYIMVARWFVAITLSILFAEVIRRFFPRVGSIVFGGR